MVKKKKQQIPKAIREEVWRKEMGRNYSGKCFVCSDLVSITNFDCAHIISEYEGGEIKVDNMKVTCRTCNLSCGTMNLIEFKWKYFSKKHPIMYFLYNFFIVLFIVIFFLGCHSLYITVDNLVNTVFYPKVSYFDYIYDLF